MNVTCLTDKVTYFVMVGLGYYIFVNVVVDKQWLYIVILREGLCDIHMKTLR